MAVYPTRRPVWSAQASTSGTVHTHAAETCIGNRPQETSVTIAAKIPYPQDLTKDPLARRPRTTTQTTSTSVIIDTKTPYPQDLIKDATARRPRTKTPTTTTPSTPSTPTMTTPSTTQRRPTSSSSFHLITPQSRRKPEPTWKTLKMLRKKKRGTRYPSTTGKTHSQLRVFATDQPFSGLCFAGGIASIYSN